MTLGTTHASDAKSGSTGYYAPEAARLAEDPINRELLEASESLDVWSLGVLLFELCTGRTLFRQDISNDDLVDSTDLTRLFTWGTISDKNLSDVFKGVENKDADAYRGPAKHLIRWCLKGRATERPTVAQILAHPLLQAGGNPGSAVTLPVDLPMRYTFFVSHAQGDAASTAKSVYSVTKQLGVECW